MSHYYSENQDSQLKITKTKFFILDHNFEFETGSGVFSIGKLDKGTYLLISRAEAKGDVLDLGCGWGGVGVTIAKAYPETNVLMTDLNKRAVMLAKRNIESNKVKNIEARHSDNFKKIPETFDTILLNPPQTAGKRICHDMIKSSFEHLNPKGTLQLVARHNKGGKGLAEKMESVFGNVKDKAKKSGYRLYVSIKDKNI